MNNFFCGRLNDPDVVFLGVSFEGYMGNSIAVQKTFHYTVLLHVEYRAVVEVVRIVPAGSLFPSVAISNVLFVSRPFRANPNLTLYRAM